LLDGYRGSVSIDEAWPFVARQALADVGHGGNVLAPLASVPAQERDRLVATVRAVLTQGGVVGAARVLYCHRNTVLGRLRRLRDLTGLDLSKSRDSAMAVVLFAGS
jgi:DNA-binding PucR family transcriptional regulator